MPLDNRPALYKILDKLENQLVKINSLMDIEILNIGNIQYTKERAKLKKQFAAFRVAFTNLEKKVPTESAVKIRETKRLKALDTSRNKRRI